MNRGEVTAAGLGALVSALAFVIGAEARDLVRAPAVLEDPVPHAASTANPTPASCDLEMAANRNLVEQVREYKDRAERATEERAVAAVVSVEASEAPAEDVAPVKSEWDLGADELRELAKRGSVKLRAPCSDRRGWRPTPETLEKLGLAPHDARVLEEAAAHAYAESWKNMKDLCADLPDNQASEPMGRDDCVIAIYSSLVISDPEGTDAAVRRAAEARAGLRAAPWVGDSRLHPVEKIALVLAEAQKSYEQELTRSLGPEDAHRAAFSEDLCPTYVSWEGAGEDPS